MYNERKFTGAKVHEHFQRLETFYIAQQYQYRNFKNRMEIHDQPEPERTGRTLEDVLENGYTFNFSDYFSTAAGILGQQFWWFVLAALVYFVVSAVAGFIPYSDMLTSIFLTPHFTAGFFIAGNKVARGKPFRFEHFFDGFRHHYLHIMLASLVISMVSVFVMLPFFGWIMSFVFDMMRQADIPFETIEGFGALRYFADIDGTTSVILMLLAIPALYLAISYSLAIQFVVFYGLEFWPALEASRKVVTQKWFWFLLFGLVVGIVAIAGLILCGVGLLASLPFGLLCMYGAYHGIMGSHYYNEPTY